LRLAPWCCGKGTDLRWHLTSVHRQRRADAILNRGLRGLPRPDRSWEVVPPPDALVKRTRGRLHKYHNDKQEGRANSPCVRAVESRNGRLRYQPKLGHAAWDCESKCREAAARRPEQGA